MGLWGRSYSLGGLTLSFPNKNVNLFLPLWRVNVKLPVSNESSKKGCTTVLARCSVEATERWSCVYSYVSFRRPSWRSFLFVCPSTPKTAPGGQEPLRQPVPVIRLKGFRDWLTVAVYMPVSSWHRAGDCGMPSPFK